MIIKAHEKQEMAINKNTEILITDSIFSKFAAFKYNREVGEAPIVLQKGYNLSTDVINSFPNNLIVYIHNNLCEIIFDELEISDEIPREYYSIFVKLFWIKEKNSMHELNHKKIIRFIFS